MNTDSHMDSDPFADSVGSDDDQVPPALANHTLSVGRNASLTITSSTLIVLDERIVRSSRFSCFGLNIFSSRSKATRSIPFFNILWVTLTKVDLTIHYARPTSKKSVAVAYINYPIDSSSHTYVTATQWTAALLSRAYPKDVLRQKRIKVLVNPFGGAGKAAKLFAREIEPIFAAAKCSLDVERTTHSGHAVEIAENLNIDHYDVVASCSGDGLPHEVFNGLGRKKNAREALRRIAVVQLPCGTGNAMSWNLNGTGDPSMAALCIVKGIRTPLDLASFTQGETRTLTFLSQSLGIVAESDLGTDNIRWMGSARFTYGFLVRLLGKTLYPSEISVGVEVLGKGECKRHYRECLNRARAELAKGDDNRVGSANSSSSGIVPNGASHAEPSSINYGADDHDDEDDAELGLPPLRFGSTTSPLPASWTTTDYRNLGNFYSGNMTIMAEAAPFFPGALPSDGLLDLVTIDGDIGRWKAVALLLAVEKGTFFDMPHVNVRKVTGFRVTPEYGKWAKVGEGAAARQHVGRLGRLMRKLGISGGAALGDKSNNRDGGYISVDGEKMPFEPFQVEVHPSLGTVLSRTGYKYESPGPAGWEQALAPGN